MLRADNAATSSSTGALAMRGPMHDIRPRLAFTDRDQVGLCLADLVP
jgi:hypothetical protein